MKARLLKSTVPRFAPRVAPFDVWDAELPGLVLRVLPTGARGFYFVYRLQGRRSRYRLGIWPSLSPDGARQLARKIAAEVADGRDPNRRREAERAETRRKQVSTLRAFLAQRYEPWALSNLRSAKPQLERIRSDFVAWLDRPMSELTPWLIETYRKRRRDLGRKPQTINREVQRVRAAVAKAVAWGVLDAHPFASIRPLRTDKAGRVRFLSDEEEGALRTALVTREDQLRAARDRFNAWRKVRHLDPLPQRMSTFVDHLRPMVLLAINSGLRRGELLSLQWGAVDLVTRMLTVRGTSSKSGQTRHVPLNAEALEVLRTWHCQAHDSGREAYVFPGTDGCRLGSVDRSWDTAAKLAGLADFRFHDLRHHFASRLVMAGEPIFTVQKLLGHASLEMTQRYAHLGPDTLASAVEKLTRLAG